MPFDLEELQVLVDDALRHRRLVVERGDLRRRLEGLDETRHA